MSHFGVIVLVPAEWAGDEESIRDCVATQLEPYCENGEWFGDNTRWDWYRVGGRWDGAIKGITEQLRGPLVACRVCLGTGKRGNNPEMAEFDAKMDPSLKVWNDQPCGIEGCTSADNHSWMGDDPAKPKSLGNNGCNGCHGNGLTEDDSFHYSSALETLERNMTTVAEMDTTHFGCLVDLDGEWHEEARMGWWGMTIEDEAGRPEAVKVSAFDQTLADIREHHPTALAVGVDCHV